MEGDEDFFGKYSANLCEIFWETVEIFLAKRLHLLTGEHKQSHFEGKVESYGSAVLPKYQALKNCVVFTDDKVIGIKKPGSKNLQRIVYDGN